MILVKYKQKEPQTWNQAGFTGIVWIKHNQNLIHGWIKGSFCRFVHFILNPRLFSL